MANCSKGCCGDEESLSLPKNNSEHQHSHNGHQHDNDEHNHGDINTKYTLTISLFIFAIGLVLDYAIKADWCINSTWIRLAWYGISYILVGFSVWREAFEQAMKFDFFNEFSLMGIATLGAFLIGEYPEGVAVMLFYTIGEMFQDAAVSKAKNNIKTRSAL